MHRRIAFITFMLNLACSSAFSENLYQLYQDAVDNDYVMKSAKAKLRADSEAYNQALAKYLPQISLDTSVTEGSQNEKRSGAPEVDLSTVPEAFRPIIEQMTATVGDHITTKQTQAKWNLVLRQELINMSYWYGIQSSDHLTKVAELTFFKVQQELIVRTTQAYLGVLRAQNNVESSKAEEDAFKQQLDQTRQRFKVGLVANTDVQEAQAAYDLAKVGRLNDEGALETSFEALTVLTGKRYAHIAPLSPKLPINMPTPSARDDWVQLAAVNNPDLNIKREYADSAKFNAKASSSARYPTVSLSANYGRSHLDSNINDLNTNIQTDGVVLSLQVPIYTGGQVSSKIREEYARYDFALEDLGSTERQVNQQIRSAHIEVVTTMHTVKARKQATVSTRSAYDATQAGYEYGTRNIVDVLLAQQNLYSAERDYGNSRYDYILSIMRLKQIGGALTPEDIVTLNNWVIEPKTK